MTDKTAHDANRPAFEASVLKRHPGASLGRNERGEYRNNQIRDMWLTWCDAQDAKAPADTVDTPEFRTLLSKYAIASNNWQQEDEWMAALAELVSHLDGLLVAARGTTADVPPKGQAVLGERITNETFQYLSRLKTFMDVAMMLLPSVSWRDCALRDCDRLKDLLDRNFGVQLTPEEARAINWSAPRPQTQAPVKLKLPVVPTHPGVPSYVVVGYRAYLRQVTSLLRVPTCTAELPPALDGTGSVNAFYVAGYNDCRAKLMELNGFSDLTPA